MILRFATYVQLGFRIAAFYRTGFLGMLLIVMADLHHDPLLCLIVHHLNEFILEVKGSLLKAHRIKPVEKHFLGLFYIPAINMV